MNSQKERVTVLDSSSIINLRGFPTLSEKSKLVMPYSAYSELHDDFSKLRADALIADRRLYLVSPSDSFVKDIQEKAKNIGTVSQLSQVDIEVVALAYEEESRGKECLIVTDDYAVQNLASAAGLAFQGARIETISDFRSFHFACPVCNYQRKTPGECKNCGTTLKRKKGQIRRLQKNDTS